MRRLRSLAIVLLLVLVLSGCSLFPGKSTRVIKVRWELVPAVDVSASSSLVVGPISLTAMSAPVTQNPVLAQPRGYELMYERTPLEWSWAEVTAEMTGVPRDAHFDFTIVKSGEVQWERVSGNKILLQEVESGAGRVIVTREGVTAEVPFVVFPAGGIVNTDFWEDMKHGFAFASGTPVAYESGDIRMADGSQVVEAPYGLAVVEKGDDFWGLFPYIHDVRGLTYTPGIIPFDASAFNYVYVVRTGDGGYAKVIFTAARSYRGDAWSFIYDYSPDGIFNTY